MKKTEKTKTYEKIIIAICLGVLVLVFARPFILFTIEYITSPDYEGIAYDNCIKEKTADGYPEEFVRKYCHDEGFWCGTMHYYADCEPEHCYFTTIEDDKKWNYLDYDEKGNKIRD